MTDTLVRLAGELRDLARAFLAWWLAELAALNPFGERLRWFSRDHRILLEMNGPRLAIHYGSGGLDRLLDTLDLPADGAADGGPDVRRVLAAAGLERRIARGQAAIRLRLAGTRPLPVTLSLPLAAEENLREAVSFELDRLIPLRVSEIHFGFHITGRDARARRIEIQAVAARRTPIDAAMVRLEAMGLRPTRVELTGDGGVEVPPCDVLPHEMAEPDRRQTSPRLVLALWVLAACLAVAAVWLPIQRLDAEGEALAQAAAETRRAGAEIQRLRTEIATFDEASRFLVNRKHATPPVSMILSEIARVLPDDTYLLEMQVTLPEVQIGGHSQSAAALIGLLEQSRFFRASEFRSPTTRDSRTGRENFSIATKVRTEAPP